MNVRSVGVGRVGVCMLCVCEYYDREERDVSPLHPHEMILLQMNNKKERAEGEKCHTISMMHGKVKLSK